MERKTFEKFMNRLSRWFSYLNFCGCILLLTGCTYSVIMNHTEGSATDMVDEQQNADPNISPTVTVPVVP